MIDSQYEHDWTDLSQPLTYKCTRCGKFEAFNISINTLCAINLDKQNIYTKIDSPSKFGCISDSEIVIKNLLE